MVQCISLWGITNMKLSKRVSSIKWSKENEKRFGLPSHIQAFITLPTWVYSPHCMEIGKIFSLLKDHSCMANHVMKTWRHRVLDHGCCSWPPVKKSPPKYVLEHCGSFSYGVVWLPLKNHYLDRVRTSKFHKFLGEHAPQTPLVTGVSVSLASLHTNF